MYLGLEVVYYVFGRLYKYWDAEVQVYRKKLPKFYYEMLEII